MTAIASQKIKGRRGGVDPQTPLIIIPPRLDLNPFLPVEKHI